MARIDNEGLMAYRKIRDAKRSPRQREGMRA